MAKGSFDWVSGRSYAWTLSYTGTGAATLEVRDQGNLVLSLSYPSGMEAGNGLQFTVSTNASIGPQTTLAATVSSLNGQSVTGSLSQTGTNQEAEQNLFFYYSPMASGFTAGGAVTLSYASLPSGGRVRFRARAGALPCTNLAPTVSLSAPAAGSLHQAGSPITLSASAADADGTVAQVEFLANGGPTGSDGTAPYGLQWTDAAPGSYNLAARATDNAGDQTLSAPVSITVNAQPTVSITAPASGTVLQAPATIGLTATASDADGAIAKVEFFNEATLIGTTTAVPYSFDWVNVPSGAYTLTAKATDDRGGNTLSSPVTVMVNAAPAVTLTAPATGARFIAPAAIQLVASATDADGAIAKVEFYEAANLLATVPQPPYSFDWTHVAPGAYTLFAKATDDLGAATLSAAVDITVAANTAPTVVLTSPTPNASYRAPASIMLTASATDADGTIAKVEFFQNQTLLATVTSAPYSFDWVNVGAGSYTLTARVTDDRGAVTTSAPVTVTVSSPGAAVYYIHTDHLSTPRVITDQQQRVVWKWDNTDPFGGNVPDEDPDGDGQRFEFNLRFPGQYFDRETNLHYNYFRDYDPAIGGFIQPEPLGLAGDINLYRYALSNPLSYYDPNGEQAARAPGLPLPCRQSSFLAHRRTKLSCGRSINSSRASRNSARRMTVLTASEPRRSN